MDDAGVVSHAALMLAALAIDAAIGWPDRLYARIGHPVSWLGRLIATLDGTLNRDGRPRAVLGAMTALVVVGIATAAAMGIVALPGVAGLVFQVFAAASLLAARSLHAHVAAVRDAIPDGLPAARIAVARIVGRDVAVLDKAGVVRAAIESLAENLSDGVVAPLFWGLVAGLPGIAAYKAINTLDSMIGHRTPRHEAFGGFAARLDDVANLVPARLTALLIAVAAGSRVAAVSSGAVTWRDARRHRSPNAGWPEAAMAGALAIRLSGPRRYGEQIAHEPWLNPAGRDPDRDTIDQALRVMRRATLLAAALLGVAAMA